MRVRIVFALFVGIAAFAASLFFSGALEPIPDRTCRDGWESPSIGIIGACSHHGGVRPRPESRTSKWFFSILSGLAVFILACGSGDSNESKSSDLPTKVTGNIPPATRVNCPKCGQEMKLRLARKGKNAGSRFWGCTRFPQCKSTLPFAPPIASRRSEN